MTSVRAFILVCLGCIQIESTTGCGHAIWFCFHAMTKRQAAFIFFKFIFATAILAWIFHKVDAARVWSSVRNVRVVPVAAGILCCWLTVVTSGWRWGRLLKVFEMCVPFWTIVCIAQIGQFFLMFLPGPAGDDLTRMLYISRFAKGRIGEACTTVLMDRCFGLASILLLALACIPMQWKLLAETPQTRWMALGMTGLGAAIFICGGVFMLATPDGSRRFLDYWINLIPKEKLREELIRMSGLLCANKYSIALVVMVALGTQLLVCGVYFLAGVAVGIHASPLVWLSFLPVVLAANAVPITIAGAGVREYLMVLFLGALAHIESEQAIAASLVAFSMMLAVSFLGGGVYIFSSLNRKHAKGN